MAIWPKAEGEKHHLLIQKIPDSTQRMDGLQDSPRLSCHEYENQPAPRLLSTRECAHDADQYCSLAHDLIL
jgi:hypothetical protein